MTDTVEQSSLVEEWHELLAKHALVSGAVESELQHEHGIGITEFEALERLACADHGKCRGQDFTDVLHLSQSASSRVIARLERAGLVARAMCEMDRRGIFVALTDEGRQLYEAAKPTQRAALAASLRSDSPS